MKKIGWIGTWVMGNPMVSHLIKAGYEVTVWNRTQSKTDNLIKQGATLCETIKELSEESDIIFTIIWDPQNVRETYFWENWIIDNAKQGSILVDMTTTEPALAKEIYELSSNKWISSLDAPVSGGDTGAINGTLSIMVWGDRECFDTVLPLFELLWASITHIAVAWTGQSTKMANQVWIAWNMVALCESLLYAERAGLNIEKTISVLQAWWANNWGYQNLAQRIVNNDFNSYFFVKHFVKDMRIALDECRKMNLTLPGLSLVHDLYSVMLAHDEWDLGLHALINSLKRMNNI